MTRIYKFVVPVEDRPTIAMPVGAVALSVGFQGETLCLWALVDTRATSLARTFRVVGTGHSIETRNLRFIGTAHMHVAPLVFHVFEELAT